MSTESSPSAPKRLFLLDNLRIFLTVLVILHHASIAYGSGGDWAASDPARSPAAHLDHGLHYAGSPLTDPGLSPETERLADAVIASIQVLP